MWQTEIHSSHALLSLGCCPMDVEMSSAICSKKNASASIPVSHDLHRQDQIATDEAQKQTMKGEYSIENKQDDEVGSAMTEELNSSVMGVAENRRQPKQEVVLFKDCPSTRSKEKKHRDQDRMESGLTMAFGSGRESDGCEDLRRYFISMGQARRLPSSQHKGVVPQPNGRWGAQIYEKHERVWLGIFNGEEDAARAYDRAAINCRGRDTMSNFIPVGSGDPEARFEREHTKEEILDMLRKHTYDEELELHTKRIMTEARSVAMNNAEASGSEGSVLRAHNENAISSTAAMDGLPRKYLFDKAVTPSDVGKLNRLVIPKQHAEKYFPLDGNSSEKGLLLDFEDKMGKVWRFRYSYWNSSQSYVLTKGWNRFVKDKKLEAGDIVSFHRGSAQPQQLYISWRRRLLGKPQLGVGPHSGQWKGKVVYPVKGLSSLNSFNSGTQATVVDNAQRMSIFWSNSHSVSTLIQEVDHVDAMWSNGALPFYFSTPPTKLTVQSSFYDIKSDGLQPMDLHVNLHNNSSEERKKLTVQSRFYDNKSDGQQPMDWHLNLHNSDNFSEGRIDIKPLHPFVNPARSCAARELETPEQKAESSLDPVTKKGIRLFGVTLDEPQRLSAEHNAQLNLFPS